MRPVVHLTRFAANPASTATLGSWPGDELHLLALAGTLHVLTPPFARSTRIIVSGERYYVGDSDASEVRVFTADGSLETIVRWRAPVQHVSAALLEAEIRKRFQGPGTGPAFQQRLTEQKSIATHTTLPAFANLHVGADGRLWVQRYVAASDTVASWLSLDVGRARMGLLRVPLNLQPLRFGANDVLVVARDSLDRESVRQYNLAGRPAQR